jgi:hypothetical protein
MAWTASYPKELAAFMDQYPGSNVVSVSVTADQIDVVMTAPSTIKAMADHFTAELTDAGWDLVENRVDAGQTAVLLILKHLHDGKMDIAISKHGGGCLVALCWKK